MVLNFVQVDAFTNRPLFGNPAAVVFDADAVSAETMQKIAREMNLSETVFILRPSHPDADYRVRIFTPMNELPFAGHPTIASAHAVLARFPEKAGATLLRQECGIGLVPVEVLRAEGSMRLRMTQAPPVYRAVDWSNDDLAGMLGCEADAVSDLHPEVVSTGVPWVIAQVRDVATIASLRPDQTRIAAACRAVRAAGLTVFAERGDRSTVRMRVRTFAPGEGVSEDPVCGSGNGSVAAYVAKHKHAREVSGEYVAEQGIEIGRDGEVYASWTRSGDQLQVRIGGEAAVSARGELLL